MTQDQMIEFLRQSLRSVIHALRFLVDEEAFAKMEHVPGFWSIFGFVACTLIIFLSKWYGHAGVMKRENYYDE